MASDTGTTEPSRTDTIEVLLRKLLEAANELIGGTVACNGFPEGTEPAKNDTLNRTLKKVVCALNQAASAGPTLYSGDDALAGNRQVDLGAFNLTFDSASGLSEVAFSGLQQFQVLRGNTNITLIPDQITLEASDALVKVEPSNVTLSAITAINVKTPAVNAATAVAGHVLKLVNATTGECEFSAP